MTSPFQFPVIRDCRRAGLIRALRPMAKKSPIAVAALGWAARNRVPVVHAPLLDHNQLGMYNHDDRLMYVDPRLQKTETVPAREALLEATVHEFRHAWQDRHRLLVDTYAIYTKPLMQLWLNRCMCEADAHAHGVAALAQANGDTTPVPLLLQKGFHDWFAQEAEGYFNALLAHFSADDGATFFYDLLKGEIEKGHASLDKMRAASRHVDTLAPDYLARLGRSFGGAHYLTGEMRAATRQRYLAPAHAARAFQAHASPDARRRLGQITKAQAAFWREIRPAPKVYPLPR